MISKARLFGFNYLCRVYRSLLNKWLNSLNYITRHIVLKALDEWAKWTRQNFQSKLFDSLLILCGRTSLQIVLKAQLKITSMSYKIYAGDYATIKAGLCYPLLGKWYMFMANRLKANLGKFKGFVWVWQKWKGSSKSTKKRSAGFKVEPFNSPHWF